MNESTCRELKFVSVKSMILALIRFASQLVELDAYNSSVGNFDSLATVLCVQQTDLTSI